MEGLILKYEKARQSQIDLKQQTPLTNGVQRQLLDQNIHLFDGILNDLRLLAIRSSIPQGDELLYSEKDIDNAYDKGYNDGAQAAATDILG